MVIKQEKMGNRFIKYGNFFILILITMLFLSDIASAAQVLQVSSSRYSLFSPWTNKASDTSLSANFTGYALLLGDNGLPVPGVNITFEIWSPAVKKATRYNITAQNGLASVSYDTYPDFTSSTDTDYGNWTIKAYVTGSPTLKDSTNMSMKAGGSGLSGGGCGEIYCHKTNTASGRSPLSPYTAGYGSTTSRAVAAHKKPNHINEGCYACHPGYAASITGLGYTGDVHKNRTCDYCHGNWAYISGSTGGGIPKMPSCSDCHLIFNNNLTDLNTVANLAGGNNVSVYSYNYDKKAPLTAHNGTNYSLIKSVPCIVCHGPAHNNSKPDPSPANTNSITESTQCTTCHTSYQKHNNNISCTVCHSQDAHDIKVFTQSATYLNDSKSPARGNCTNCHQNATFLTILTQVAKAGSYSGSAPQVQKPLNHSTDSAGTKWGTYWTSQNAACKYCHGDSKHSASGLGLASVAVDTDTVGGPIGTGTVCASCHNSTDNDYGAIMALLIPDPVAFKPGVNWNLLGTDHALYGTTDADCKSCHGGVLSGPSATISEFVHNVDVGRGGGPDCVSCHDIGAGQAKVDVSKMNTSTSIHNTLNSGATATRADNKRCYACHTNSTVAADGFVHQAELPTSGHPDKYNVPRNCMDCHDKGNFSALIVKEHYSAGYDIKTKPYTNTNASCVNCHNKTEMIIINNDPAGPKSEFARVSHYGSNKTGTSPYNAVGVSNCTLCHQGSSAFSTEMVNAAWNASIKNHTELGNNPGCTNANCHNSGRIHESTLTKPALVLPNSSYCLTCHTTVQKHNGSLNCDQCHLETNKNIHPVQYLQPSGTFLINNATNKASAVNCTSCHQATLSGFSTAIRVKTPLSHSNDNGGSKWGSYWTSQKGACLYCHGNSKHNTSALGKVLTAIGSDAIGDSIGTGTLCSSCHNSGDSNYAATMNILNPYPVANVPGSNYNSSGTNHVTYGTTDADCLPCHGSALSASPTMSEFPHNVATATGCTACHGQPPNGLTRNNTDGAHTLHKDAGYGNVPQTGCNYCHSNGGINDGGIHPNRIYNVSFNASVSSITYTPNLSTGRDDTCAGLSCHTNGLSAGAKNGTAIWNSSTAGRCDVCHSAFASGLPATGNHTKHYTTKGYSCATCHGTGADAGIQSGHKTNALIDMSFTGTLGTGGSINATRSCTVYCHSPNPNDAKPKPTWNISTVVCGSCHSIPPAITRSGATPHAGVTDCDTCHGTGANTGNQSGHINRIIDGGGASCTGCHSSVATSLGLHSNLSGTSAVEDSDCQTCHFGSFSMVTGAANSSNTLYCQACHTSSGTGPVKPTNPGLIKDGLSHGSADCKWCHAAGDQPAYKYHAIGPKGTATGANCGTCHTSNLMDEPFRAPGITHYNSAQECFYCHTPMDNHAVGALSDSTSPSLNTISVITPVTSGTSAQIQATVTDGMVQIAAAQYQVTNISGTVIPWTNMTAFDGRFDTANEIVNSTLSTSNLIGTYTVSIKGMASAYKTDPSKPYYPLNGMWSSVSSTTITVTQPRGYVNGTVRNGTNAIAGAVVSANTGESAITDSNGNYSMNLVIGNHQLSARKDPEYYPGSNVGVNVNTTLPAILNFNLNRKPTGTISGIVRIR